MHEYWHVILESIIDVAKILPFLFIVYYVIELIEFKQAIKLQNSKLLKGDTSPIFGSLLGCVPQCGFSVISTDLFNNYMLTPLTFARENTKICNNSKRFFMKGIKELWKKRLSKPNLKKCSI